MIDFLMRLHSGEDFLSDVIVSPAEIEVELAGGFCDDIPLEFFGC